MQALIQKTPVSVRTCSLCTAGVKPFTCFTEANVEILQFKIFQSYLYFLTYVSFSWCKVFVVFLSQAEARKKAAEILRKKREIAGVAALNKRNKRGQSKNVKFQRNILEKHNLSESDSEQGKATDSSLKFLCHMHNEIRMNFEYNLQILMNNRLLVHVFCTSRTLNWRCCRIFLFDKCWLAL